MLLDKADERQRPVAVVPVGEDVNNEALKITQTLRLAGFRAEQGYSGNLKKRMMKADKMQAKAVVIVGSDELQRGEVVVKRLDDGQQKNVAVDKLVEELSK